MYKKYERGGANDRKSSRYNSTNTIIPQGVSQKCHNFKIFSKFFFAQFYDFWPIFGKKVLILAKKLIDKIFLIFFNFLANQVLITITFFNNIFFA